MKKFQSRTQLALALILAGVLLAACGAATAAPTEPVEEATEAIPATEAPIAQQPTEAAEEENTVEPTQASQSGGEISYAAQIAPIIERSCMNCHGGMRISEGLNMKSYEQLMAGSDNGAVITPGDAANSLVVKLTQSGKMPKRGAKLTPEEVQLLVDWINAGAPNN